MVQAASPFCNSCGGTGVLIEPRNNQAEARVCTCSEQCHTCRGSRFVMGKDKAGRDSARMCQCEVRRIRVRMFNEAQVPGKYFDARLEERFKDSQNEDVFNTLLLMASDFQPGQKGLLLMGPSGVGKTFLVAAFVHEIIFRRGIPAHFRDFFHLLSDLRSGYSQDKPEAELLGPLVEVEVLVIDELGKGRNSPWEQNILDVIISQRYNNQKTTIFTSNYTESRKTTLVEKVRGKDGLEGDNETRDTLLDRIGPRIHSRLKEMCDFLNMTGLDRRHVESG